MSYTTGIEFEKSSGEKLTLKEALNKVYLVKRRFITVPKVLIGKRFKLVLVDEKKESKSP